MIDCGDDSGLVGVCTVSARAFLAGGGWMDRQQIGLKLVLEALGRELRLDDFPSRLSLQKTIYLVQAAGVDLGYSYSWYLRGPYSSALTRDAFALKAELARNA